MFMKKSSMVWKRYPWHLRAFQQTLPERIYCTMVLFPYLRARVAMLSRMGAKTSHRRMRDG